MATLEKLTDSPKNSEQSIDLLTDRNLNAILQKEQLNQSDLTRSQRFAGYVAAFRGTMTFVWIHVANFTL